MVRMRWSMVGVMVCAALAMSGCDGRIPQCNRLIKVINEEQGAIKAASGDDAAALNTFADTLESVANKVSGVELEDEQLSAFRDAYAAMAKDLAKASRDTASALEKGEHKEAADGAKEMSGFGERESELVDSINKYCSGSA